MFTKSVVVRINEHGKMKGKAFHHTDSFIVW